MRRVLRMLGAWVVTLTVAWIAVFAHIYILHRATKRLDTTVEYHLDGMQLQSHELHLQVKAQTTALERLAAVIERLEERLAR